MLARTYKSAAELGIPEHERDALVEVLHQIDVGLIKLDQIDMSSYHTCYTVHCIAGWANTINHEAFPEISPARTNWHRSSDLRARLPVELTNLFGVGPSQYMRYASPEQAVKALRSYLETGTLPIKKELKC